MHLKGLYWYLGKKHYIKRLVAGCALLKNQHLCFLESQQLYHLCRVDIQHYMKNTGRRVCFL